MIEYTFEFDIHKKKLVKDCYLWPTTAYKIDAEWLFAVNNKYTDEIVDPEKVGKWMIFLKKKLINATWSKIKMAVTSGELWHSKVSTSNFGKPKEIHAIMIYTKDYTDLADVIHVLEYLESSGIKPPNVVLKYKTDQQTSAGVYHGNKQKPWIYSSDTVRTIGSLDSVNYDTYNFDIRKKKLVTDCNLYPSEVIKSPSWLIAKNNKCPDESVDPEKIGWWRLFLPKHKVDAVWDKIKTAVKKGQLWRSSVSTSDPERLEDLHIIMVYTEDYTNVNDVILVLDYLESSGIKPSNQNIKYRKDNQTSALNVPKKLICAGTGRSWIYSSNLIRSMGDSIHDHYDYDIYKKNILTDSKLSPSKTFKSDFLWLYATNNKYTDESFDPEKIGKWMLNLSKDTVDAAWDQIKQGVTNGKLWNARVSTTDPERLKDKYVIMVYTKDTSDISDIISVHHYLESSGLKPSNEVIEYVKDQQIHHNGGEKNSCVYTSDTLRLIEWTLPPGSLTVEEPVAYALVTMCPCDFIQADKCTCGKKRLRHYRIPYPEDGSEIACCTTAI